MNKRVCFGATIVAAVIGLCACDPRSLAQRAAAGDPKAQYDYARNEHGGETAPPPGQSYNERASFVWMLRAANQGYEPAFCEVAFAYWDGRGPAAVDKAEAVRWNLKGAAQKDGACEKALSQAYASGDGVTKDPIAAYAWMLVAIWDLEHQPHVFRGGAPPPGYYEERDLNTYAETMTADQIAAAGRLAASWRPELAPTPPATQAPIGSPAAEGKKS